MNRRQKMKRMKRELEWYKKQMVPCKREYITLPFRIETVKASCAYSCMMLEHLRKNDNWEWFDNLLKEDFSKALSKQIGDYIQFRSGCIDGNGDLIYTGELKVVVPHGGDRI